MLSVLRYNGGGYGTRKRVYAFESVPPPASSPSPMPLSGGRLAPTEEVDVLGLDPASPVGKRTRYTIQPQESAQGTNNRRTTGTGYIPYVDDYALAGDERKAAPAGRGGTIVLPVQPRVQPRSLYWRMPMNAATSMTSEEPAEKNHEFRISRFLEMCHRHAGFIRDSVVIDEYLLAMASLYLKRAGLNAIGYTKDRYFFFALYLAIETEEDLPRGAEEILLYLLGPCSGVSTGVLGKSMQQMNWEKRLSRFLAGKDKFWARLDYRTWLSEEKCRKEMRRFPKQDDLVHRQRGDNDFLYW